MKKLTIFTLILALVFILASCGNTSSTSTQNSQTVTAAPTAAATEAEVLDDPSSGQSETTSDFTLTDADGNAVTPSGTTYTITSAGEYTATGKLDGGQIVVDASSSDKVVINLAGASISNSTDAPIVALEASKVEIKAKNDTYNTIIDSRTGTPSDDDDSDHNGAIYAECDLELSGKGTLIVTSSYDNGVKTKDDLEIKNITLKVTAVGNALKGNDSVTVESGSVILISTSGDGIKTSNSDLSSKGNQRGTVTISGGQVDVYSACDGIDASYDVVISGDDTVVNVFTSDYSDYADDANVSGELYLIVGQSIYKSTYDYYAYFYNEESDGTWVKCTYDSMVYSGRTAYYGLSIKQPSGYENVIFNIVTKDQTPDGVTYVASTSGEKINTSLNAYLITGVSSSLISGDWVQLTTSSGSSSKTTYSSKGVKAANSITVSGGALTIKCMDDGLHANMGDELENGSVGVGDITISGGTVTITAADDGIHADNILTISGGSVNVAKSHEGLEGNVINLSGGAVYVYGEDDGINACKGNTTPLINITGGYVDITTPSGDTDAVDSNGNITISGGLTVVKGGSSSGSFSGSIDVDGTVKVTGGTILAFGGICSTPTSGSVNTYISSGTSFTAGDYTLADSNGSVIASFTLSSSYSSVWISSEQLTLGSSFTLSRAGTTVLSWTQSQSTVGSAGNAGGFGGMGRGR